MRRRADRPGPNCRPVLIHVFRSNAGRSVWASNNLCGEYLSFYLNWMHGGIVRGNHD